jgi:hypothetical protein
MAKIKVVKEAYIKYQLTTWQGVVEINGEEIKYRYSEHDNGDELYVYDGNDWVESDLSEENHKVLYAAIQEWGNPEELGSAGEEVDIDDSYIEDYI